MKTLETMMNSDIVDFFESIENQTLNDKKETLRILLQKYNHSSTSEFLMGSFELTQIKSSANDHIKEVDSKKLIGKSKINANDLGVLSIIEATIAVLNRNNCLKRLPKFNYREDRLPEE